MPIAIRTFTVTGRGPFPMDMLRYDSAWAMDSSDAQTIGQSFDIGKAGKWSVRLNTADRTAPTIGRWESFNCRVED